MRKSLFYIFLCLLAGTFISSAQPYDTYKELVEDSNKAGGVYYMYDFLQNKSVNAPEGYVPFYISYFGRHGARYALPNTVYEDFLVLLQRAYKDGKLTNRGEILFRNYKDFYRIVSGKGGMLTDKGAKQLKDIAGKIFRDYPEVFKGKTYAEAISTDVKRVILSMDSFLSELKSLDIDFEVKTESDVRFLSTLDPNSHRNPKFIKSKPKNAEAEKEYYDFLHSKIDLDAISLRFFNDLDYLEEYYGKFDFVFSLRNIIVDIQCLDKKFDGFKDMLSKEELINIWEVRNFGGYMFMGLYPLTDNKGCYSMAPALKEIIEDADKDMATNTLQLRLRFSHDTGLLPLLSFMNVNSFGVEISDPESVKDYWRCFDIPMAANLQIIFYRNYQSKDILIKLLLNGKEAFLPIEPVISCFYSWEEVKKYYKPLIEKALDYLKRYSS